MKNLPNLLSVSRIIIGILLFFLGGQPLLFTLLYLYCGLSDVADGYIARRLKIESALGAKLDSAGDVVLYTLITFMLFAHTQLMEENAMLWLVISIFIIKLINVLLTRIRFGQWAMMHTLANKVSGLLVYVMLPVYILFPYAPVCIAIAVAVVALMATVEEAVIVFTAKEYNLNQKSIFAE